MSYLPEYRK